MGSRSLREAPRPPVYLDHHATTPLDPRVAEAMAPYWSGDFGNASSRTHVYGWRAEAAVESARERIAAALGAADPREIVFTSGATESDNLALQGVATAEGDHVISAAPEHAAVLDTLRALGRRGVRATLLPVDGEGRVDPSDVAKAIEPRTVLVSVGAANGEIGTLQPLAEIGRACAERDVLFHSDAAQAVGKVPLDVEALGLDLLSASAHKLHGPKGVGLLYVRLRRRSGARLRIEPLLHGGGQERGLRSGTLPVPLIVGFAEAVAVATAALEEESARLAALRDALLVALQGALPGVHVNGPARSNRLPGNLNVSFDGVAADALIAALEDVALSSGSACSSARPEPSHVLAALGLPAERARGAVRMGLGRFTREADVARAAERIASAVRTVRGEKAALGLAR